MAALVGLSTKTDECVPFVSQYSDCTDENKCSGCQTCMCIASGEWMCNPVNECIGGPDPDLLSEADLTSAFDNIKNEFRESNRDKNGNSILVPPPADKVSDSLLDLKEESYGLDIDRNIVQMMGRRKRSVDAKNKTEKGQLYLNVEEANEETLKNDNITGTLLARKFDGVINPSKLSRRTGHLIADDGPKNESLQIEFNEKKSYDHQITENKIDTRNNEKLLALEKDINGNHSLKIKDKELSKLVVNELKQGTELIGDNKAPVMSNITFTPENDTLTAMAFIAGNLLNQLWDMEKDSSEETKETAELKHEKIEDLLELFKEPLNLRQETFLKSALETLSVVVDKDKPLNNVSLCEKIEESKKILQNTNENIESNCKNSQKEKTVQFNPEVTADAISKINNVLNLVGKFQEVKKALYSLRTSNENNTSNHEDATEPIKQSQSLSNDEKSSLDIFGKILEKVSKLLLPPKRGKKMAKTIKNHHIFGTSSNLASTLKNVYGTNVDHLSLTAKDKLLFDYLSVVKSNPNCLLKNLETVTKPVSKIEGDILLNLSEFLKIKSFVDLMKLLEPEKKSLRSDDAKTPQTTTMEAITNRPLPSTTQSSKLFQTKEKLKAHLKSIIDDLRELQMAKGVPASNLSIANTLPCIYNMLNADAEVQQKIKTNSQKSPFEKVSEMFDILKKDFAAVPSRRSNIANTPKPKSAAIWERVIKTFRRNNPTRRTMGQSEPKTYDEIKKMIENVESSSQTYKRQVIVKGVPPSKKLILLKNLKEENKKYIDILEHLVSLELNKLTSDTHNELSNIVHNAANTVTLNEEIAKSLNRSRSTVNVKDDVEFINMDRDTKPKGKQLLRMLDVTSPLANKPKIFKRDDVINQLIKNRMHLYIRIKESKGLDLSNDVNYSLAKKILEYLDAGNYTLARELYKYIISQKEKAMERKPIYSNPALPLPAGMNDREPLMKFTEPSRQQPQIDVVNSDLWLRQLMNLKKI